MKVLIACEFSARERDAFRSQGHDAWSCDLMETEGDPRYHIQGNVLDHLDDGWDLMIGHPPCTFLANSGVQWLFNNDGTKNEERWESLREGVRFFKALMEADIPRIAIENPVPHRYALDMIGKPYSQIVQPYEFGDPETKKTCYWLKNLPPLIPTRYVEPEYIIGKNGKRYSRIHFISPRKNIEKQKDRSRSFLGISEHMAIQWGNLQTSMKDLEQEE